MNERDVQDIAESLNRIADSFYVGEVLVSVASSLGEIATTLSAIDGHLAELLDLDRPL